MSVFISVISVIILFLIVILLSPARIYAEVKKDETGNNAKVTAIFWFFKIILFDSEKDTPPQKPRKEEDKQNNPQKSLDGMKETFDALYAALRSLKKRFTISLFSADIRLGTGDAASTGIMTGSAYGVIYYILGVVDNFFVLKKHHVSVTPDFDRECFYIDFKGRFSLRTIYALIMVSKILPILKSA